MIKTKYQYQVVCVLLMAIAATGCFKKHKKINPIVTLWRNDKDPYGSYYAYKNIGYAFPNAEIKLNDKSPSSYGFTRLRFSENNMKGRAAYIIISPHIFPDRSEINSLMEFVAEGNQVFMSSFNFGDSLLDYFKLRLGRSMTFRLLDSGLNVSAMDPVRYDSLPFQYPGFAYDNYVDSMDSKFATVLGYDSAGRPDYVKFSYKGGGAVFLHFAPLALTNFFLLHKNNKVYFDEIFSQMAPSVSHVIWDDYFRRTKDSQFSALNFLLSNQALRWAFWLVLLLFLLIYLFESKRKQKWIPIHDAPRNSSLDFVKTIGRLYYQQKDNSNLLNKMTTHFLDYVRTKYNLSSSELDEDFADRLSYKSGYDKMEMRSLIQEFQRFSKDQRPTDLELIQINKKLEAFYKLA
ncbi:MAG: hypothetical protein C5B59_05205 [Bacteroidetes bacterium]|nr:MAG: hypothetical protein C5B59_05205 [Bacteroidota bacterium]